MISAGAKTERRSIARSPSGSRAAAPIDPARKDSIRPAVPDRASGWRPMGESRPGTALSIVTIPLAMGQAPYRG
jgi:hypothetical protein